MGPSRRALLLLALLLCCSEAAAQKDPCYFSTVQAYPGLVDAAHAGNLKQLKKVLRHPAEDPQACAQPKEEIGRAIEEAIATNHRPAIPLLLDATPTLSWGIGQLFSAAILKGWEDVATAIAAKGTDSGPSWTTPDPESQATLKPAERCAYAEDDSYERGLKLSLPTHFAAFHGASDTLTYLLSHHFPTTPEGQEARPDSLDVLELAVAGKQVATAKRLLASGDISALHVAGAITVALVYLDLAHAEQFIPELLARLPQRDPALLQRWLLLAVGRGSVPLATLMLDAGALPNLEIKTRSWDREGRSASRVALQCANPAVAALLLARGGAVDASALEAVLHSPEAGVVFFQSPAGQTFRLMVEHGLDLQLCPRHERGCLLGRVKELKDAELTAYVKAELLKLERKRLSLAVISTLGDADLLATTLQSHSIDEPDADGMTALMREARLPTSDGLLALVAKGAKLEQADPRHRTALVHAIDAGRIDNARVLLEHGANSNVRFTLSHTIGFGPDEGDAYTSTLDDMTPLGMVLSRVDHRGRMTDDDRALGKLLIEKGADVNAMVNGYTPLEFTIDLELVQLLLQRHVDVNHTSPWGDTTLMHAAAFGSAKVIELLLAAGARVNDANKEGDTALMVASNRASPECVSLLLAHGAQVNAKNKKGESPLLVLGSWESLEKAQLLLAAGADVNAVSAEGHTAVEGHDSAPETVAFLVAHGAKLAASEPRQLLLLLRALEKSQDAQVQAALVSAALALPEAQQDELLLAYYRTVPKTPSVLDKTLIEARWKRQLPEASRWPADRRDLTLLLWEVAEAEGHLTTLTKKTPFESEPKAHTGRSYLVAGDVVCLDAVSGDYVWAIYRNAKGEFAGGWIKR